MYINKKEKKKKWTDEEKPSDEGAARGGEAVKRRWDGAPRGLAQRSESAGNYNHHLIQCTTSHAHVLSGPPVTTALGLRLLGQTSTRLCWPNVFLFFILIWWEKWKNWQNASTDVVVKKFKENGWKRCSPSNHGRFSRSPVPDKVCPWEIFNRMRGNPNYAVINLTRRDHGPPMSSAPGGPQLGFSHGKYNKQHLQQCL